SKRCPACNQPASFAKKPLSSGFFVPAVPVGAAAGCDLLMLIVKNKIKRSQPSPAPTGQCDLQRLFIAAKTRQARSNPTSWNVREDQMVQLCSIEQAVDDVLARLPTHIHMGLPLGLGKPNHFVNALYRRV